MPAISVSLSDESYRILEWVMEKEKLNRSQVVSYLIKMGWIYRYKILEEEKGKEKKNGEERPNSIN